MVSGNEKSCALMLLANNNKQAINVFFIFMDYILRLDGSHSQVNLLLNFFGLAAKLFARVVMEYLMARCRNTRNHLCNKSCLRITTVHT